MTELMRRMSARGPATAAELARPDKRGEGETRTQRRLALLRGRFGAAEERRGAWRLRFAPEWLDISRLPPGSRVADESPSALDLARGMETGAPVFCETQTRGRGRRGRRWLAMPAGAILFAVRVPAPPSPLGLPLAAGVGVLRALEAEGCANLKLKWPNDILDRDGRKIGGILAEGAGGGAATTEVTVGVGINLLMTPELRAAIGRPAAGLLSGLEGAQRRNSRARAAATAVVESAAVFAREGVAGFLPEALARHVSGAGEEVCFRGGDGAMRRGEFAGFGERGELLLRGRRGVEAHVSGEFAEGDVSGG